eukprot:1190421-Prorocentrum_minimum.AAC.2
MSRHSSCKRAWQSTQFSRDAANRSGISECQGEGMSKDRSRKRKKGQGRAGLDAEIKPDDEFRGVAESGTRSKHLFQEAPAETLLSTTRVAKVFSTKCTKDLRLYGVAAIYSNPRPSTCVPALETTRTHTQAQAPGVTSKRRGTDVSFPLFAPSPENSLDDPDEDAPPEVILRREILTIKFNLPIKRVTRWSSTTSHKQNT